MMQYLYRFTHKDYFHDLIDCLITALEARDIYTAGHSSRVGDMSFDLAKKMGLRGKELVDIHMAAHLHDIGKIGIPEDILNKPGRLLPHEWEQIRLHPEIGCNILSKSKSIRDIAVIVLHHHERWDGKGYPHGLRGNRIPQGSRIIAVADSIDAMTSNRSYRPPMTWEECSRELILNKGVQFDATVVEAAEELWGKWPKQRYHGPHAGARVCSGLPY